MMKDIFKQKWMWVMLAGYFILGLSYLLATPPLEASDEYKHYPVVHYIQQQRHLPVLDPDDPGLWLQEGAQPPLYYVLMALATAVINTNDLEEIHQVNPHAFVGNPNQIGNKNIMIHQPAREQFPWHGSILAIYIVRFISMFIGAGTILLTARLGLLLGSMKVAMLAAALTAFNPMFVFVNTAVNNDSLAILLGAAGLLALVKLWQDTPDPRQQWWRYVMLGLILGAGILTKLSLAGLLALAGLALAIRAWQQKRWSYLFVGGLTVLATAVLVCGWWLLRNVQIYGDPTGLNAFIAVQGVREEPLTWAGWVDEFGTFFRSYWGLFGGVNIAAPNWMYWVYNLAVIIGLIGLLRVLFSGKKKTMSGLWLLFAWLGVVIILLLRWTFIYPSFQGRLLFPTLAGANVLWAIGLLAWVKSPWQNRAITLAGSFIWLIAFALPWLVIRPVYAFPEPVTAVPLEASFGPISFQWQDDIIQLVGVEIPPNQSITANGEPVEVVLYWQAVTDISDDYLSTIHLLGRNFESAGSVNRYPASGAVPTSQWQAGQIWRDVYHVYAHDEAVAPSRLRIKANLYNPNESADLAAASADGSPLELVIVGEARLAAAAPLALEPPNAQTISFADNITLTGYGLAPAEAEPGTPLTIDLYWKAAGAPTQAYTVFIHLLAEDGSQLAGADGPPVNNDYPTSMWQAGDEVLDRHIMQMPADLASGTYQLSIGLYDPQSGVRVLQTNGQDSFQIPITVK